MGLKGKSVEEILKKLDPEQKAIAGKLRKLVKKSIPGIKEIVKWGNITYLLDGKNVSWVLFYPDHVDLGFFMGAKLKSKRIEGTGNGLRHVKVWKIEDIDEREFTRLLKEAARLVK